MSVNTGSVLDRQIPHRHNWRMNRLRQIRKERGWSQQTLADKAGLPQPSISRFELGERSPDEHQIRALARALEVPPSALIDDDAVNLQHLRPSSHSRLPVIGAMLRGEAEAGVWREAAEWPPSDGEPVMIPQLKEHKGLEIFSIRLRGRSMDKAFPVDSWVQCVDLFASNTALRTDDYVIVRRIDADKRIETTCRQVELLEGGAVRLWSRSTLPRYQAPLTIPSVAGDESTAIVGLVLTFTGEVRRL